jgi:translocation and assembly module TamA
MWILRHLLLLALVLLTPARAAADAPALNIDGAEGELRKNITAFVDLSSYRCDEAEWLREYLRRSSRKKAKKALEALGHYHATIESTLEQDARCWSVHLDVDPGPRTVIRKVDLRVTGGIEKLPGFRKLEKRILSLQGAPLNHRDYEEAKTDLELLASRFGFFSSTFSRRSLAIDRKHNAAEIQLYLKSGPRYHFGEIRIESETLGPRLLREFLIIHEGDPFDSEKLTRQQQILYDSNYFASVEVIPLRHGNGGNTVPISIHLKERKRHAYRLGIGYSTDTGARVSFGFKNRYLNRRGHRYDLETNWSQVSRKTTFNYGIPLGEQGTHRLDLSFGSQREDTDTSSSTTTQYGINFSRTLGDGWKRNASLRAFRETFTTVDNEETTVLLIPGLSVSKTVLDDPLYPRSGWRLSAQIKGSRQSWLLSDIDMVQLSGHAKLVRPWNRARLLLRGNAGTTSTSDFGKLPATLRFYAGGDASVRGYGYKTLGPLNADGEVNGGRNLLTGSAELEYPIREKWGLAVFADAGNAFDSFTEYDLHKSVGFGIRYHSIIGPIRIDLAFPFDEDRNYRLHLSMGPDL